jgi:hypothetical protein
LTALGALDENRAEDLEGDALNRFSAPVLLCVVALTLALPAAPSRAQGATWDQERVTALAVELADVIAELQVEFRREGSPHIASGQARARHSFRDSLRVLRTESRALASELEAGAGLEETQPIVRRAGVVIRDLREEGRRMSWKEPVAGLARRAEELISQIAPFYVGEAGEGEAGGEKKG